MQTEERDAEQTVEEKLPILFFVFMQDFIYAKEAGQGSEVRFNFRFQITQNVMLAVTCAIDLIVGI